MNRILLGAAAIAVAVPATAQMQAPAAPVAPMAPRMEMTHTRDQVVAKVRDHFAKMDVNRDGFVSRDEMQAMRGKHKGMKRMAQGARMGRDPAAAFDRIDANRDGMISRDEFSRGHELRKQRRAERAGQQGAAPDGRGGMKMHRMGGGMMKLADLDRDGRVSLQEATTKALERFDRIDTNRDGRITPDERRSHHEQRRQMRAPKAG